MIISAIMQWTKEQIAAAVKNIDTSDRNESFSWNDLTDKPFYEETEHVVIEWDGNTDGLECVSVPVDGGIMFYKINDTVPTKAELVGRTATFFDGETTQDIILSEVDGSIMEFPEYDGVIIVGGPVYIMPRDNTIIDGYTFPTAGWYAVYEPGYPYITHIEFDTTTVHSIDPKFLPEGSVGWEEDNRVFINWDGNTEGREVVDPTGEMLEYYIHVSDIVPEPNSFVGATLAATIIEDGTVVSATVEENHIHRYNDDLYMASAEKDDLGFGVIVVKAPVDIDVLHFPKAGVYFLGTSMYYTSRCALGSIDVTQIDPKYIPPISWNNVIDRPYGYTSDPSGYGGTLLPGTYKVYATFSDTHMYADDYILHYPVVGKEYDINPTFAGFAEYGDPYDDYTGVCKEADDAIKERYGIRFYIGNLSIPVSDNIYAEDTGEEYCITFTLDTATFYIPTSKYSEAAGKETQLRIFGPYGAIKTINEDFIPDTIARVADIPTVESILAALPTWTGGSY